MTAPGPGDELREAVEGGLPGLRGISEADSARPRAPGKWSAREVLGHLIDSASNNHHRFVRAGLQPGLVFSGYEQEPWVRRQGYREAPWSELIELWRLYNRHLARVMDATPEDLLGRETLEHNFHEIAFHKVSAGAPATLEYLMRDYVAHLRHHLGQIVGATSPGAGGRP